MIEALDFPGRLRALRAAAGLTQAELAERVGWTKSRVNRLERPGGWRPRPETVVRLAAGLRCDPGELDPGLSDLKPPEGAVFLVPDLDLIGAYRPWRPADAGRLADLGIDPGEPIGCDRLGEIAEALGAEGLPLCLMP